MHQNPSWLTLPLKRNSCFLLTSPDTSFPFAGSYHDWRRLSGGSEKAMAPHSSTLAWKIPWTEEPGGLQSMGSQRVNTTERLPCHFSLSCIGEGNGNPPQCSCLQNPRDGGAWWAAVYGVAQSRTWLKRLSSSSVSVGYVNLAGKWGDLERTKLNLQQS